jgi:hypothetical protein
VEQRLPRCCAVRCSSWSSIAAAAAHGSWPLCCGAWHDSAQVSYAAAIHCRSGFLARCNPAVSPCHTPSIAPDGQLLGPLTTVRTMLAAGSDAVSPALDNTLAARLHEFNARDIVFTAYACSRLRGTYVALPSAIAAEVEARGFSDFTLGEVAYIARGLATHNALTPQLQAALRHLMDDDTRIERWQLVHMGKSLKMAKST